jgi:hypothetical protein
MNVQRPAPSEGVAGLGEFADVRNRLARGPVEGKVRCHSAVVTDVTDKAGQDMSREWASAAFLLAGTSK